MSKLNSTTLLIQYKDELLDVAEIQETLDNGFGRYGERENFELHHRTDGMVVLEEKRDLSSTKYLAVDILLRYQIYFQIEGRKGSVLFSGSDGSLSDGIHFYEIDKGVIVGSSVVGHLLT